MNNQTKLSNFDVYFTMCHCSIIYIYQLFNNTFYPDFNRGVSVFTSSSSGALPLYYHKAIDEDVATTRDYHLKTTKRVIHTEAEQLLFSSVLVVSVTVTLWTFKIL